MVRAALVALLVSLPAAATARPFTAGVSLGTTHDQKDDEIGVGADRTIGLFGRLALTPRLSGQLELMKYDHDHAGLVVRSGTALLVVDLSAHPRWVPTIMVGLGVDRASASPCAVCLDDGDGFTSSGRRIEGGFGLEYRAEGGFTLGADIRLGGRTIDRDDQPGVIFAGRLQESEYRRGRVWAGIRF